MKRVREIARNALDRIKVTLTVKSSKGASSNEEDVLTTEEVAGLMAEHLQERFNIRTIDGKGAEDGTHITFELNPKRIESPGPNNLY